MSYAHILTFRHQNLTNHSEAIFRYNKEMVKIDEYSVKHFIQDLGTFVSPYKRKFSFGVFFRLTSDIGRLYPAFAISQIIPLLGTIREPASYEAVSWYLIVWLISAIYVGFGHDFSKYLGNQVAESAGLSLYKKCLGHIFLLDLSWHELEGSGNKMKRIDRGYDGVNESIRRIFDVLIEVSVNIVGVVVIFFTLDKMLSLSIVFFIITYFMIGKYLLKRASAQEQVVSRRMEELSGLTFESLNNILTIKALAFQTGVMKVVGNHVSVLIEEIRKRIFYYKLQSGVLNSYFFLFELAVISYIIWNIFQGNYGVSLLLLFVGLFQKVGQSTNELVSVTQQMVVNKIWLSRAMGLLNVKAEIENPENNSLQLAYPRDWKKLILKNIHFAYKKGQALSDISFTVNRGESVGIVGLSGAGKSTLFKLLLDLYEDYEGDILLDDIPIKNILRQAYITHVSVVLQDTELFNMSLRENIEIANLKSRAAMPIEEAIKMAHLSDVVEGLGNKLETIVGEKGVKLSGGQRQRVGIARAIFREPDILLLDEATSHLDGHSEKQIQEAIADVKGKYTTIVIAHRLSTIQQMDKIIVLDKGSVKEMGTFQELLSKKGAFARMWQMQKL